MEFTSLALLFYTQVLASEEIGQEREKIVEAQLISETTPLEDKSLESIIETMASGDEDDEYNPNRSNRQSDLNQGNRQFVKAIEKLKKDSNYVRETFYKESPNVSDKSDKNANYQGSVSESFMRGKLMVAKNCSSEIFETTYVIPVDIRDAKQFSATLGEPGQTTKLELKKIILRLNDDKKECFVTFERFSLLLGNKNSKEEEAMLLWENSRVIHKKRKHTSNLTYNSQGRLSEVRSSSSIDSNWRINFAQVGDVPILKEVVKFFRSYYTYSIMTMLASLSIFNVDNKAIIEGGKLLHDRLVNALKEAEKEGRSDTRSLMTFNPGDIRNVINDPVQPDKFKSTLTELQSSKLD